jgi:solute carrier family 13 (sodium-dependent dicarboxylate transporter), member 2/3/5
MLAALMALAVTWWLSEALPAATVALMVAALAVLTGLAPPKQAFGAFGSPLLFMFVGSFFFAEAMKVHGLGERIAAAMATLSRGPVSLLAALSATTFVLSTMMSNAAATAIVLPIALAAAGGADRRFQAALVLAIAWGASMGGIVTPVGTPPNLIGIAGLRQHGHDVDFGTWVLIGLPIGAVMLAAMWAVLIAIFGLRRVEHAPAALSGIRTIGPWSPGERSTLVAILVALGGWLAPTVLDLGFEGSAAARWAKTHLTEETVAVVAGCMLFVLPGGARGRRRPALTWTEATRIDWGVILLFGGGMLLGDLARDTGLTAAWGHELVELTGAHSTWAIVALCTGISIVLSEATSNTATATLMVPLAIGLASATGASPVPAVLGATIGSSFGFMMPISTAPNAMAYGTGKVTMGQMMRSGIVFDAIGFVVVVAGLRVLCPALGLM